MLVPDDSTFCLYSPVRGVTGCGYARGPLAALAETGNYLLRELGWTRAGKSETYGRAKCALAAEKYSISCTYVRRCSTHTGRGGSHPCMQMSIEDM